MSYVIANWYKYFRPDQVVLRHEQTLLLSISSRVAVCWKYDVNLLRAHSHHESQQSEENKARRGVEDWDHVAGANQRLVSAEQV